MSRWILAQQSVDRKLHLVRQMGSRFEQPDPDLYWKIPVVILLFAATGLLLWVLYQLQRRRQEKEVSPRPMRLFVRTMRMLGVSVPDIWQLWRLARRLKLRHPTALLISPLYFDHVVNKDCSHAQGQSVRPDRHRRLMAVRTTLFGADNPSP